MTNNLVGIEGRRCCGDVGVERRGERSGRSFGNIWTGTLGLGHCINQQTTSTAKLQLQQHIQQTLQSLVCPHFALRASEHGATTLGRWRGVTKLLASESTRCGSVAQCLYGIGSIGSIGSTSESSAELHNRGPTASPSSC